MPEANPRLITRNGWWPSPWWLQWADHVWLTTSGDCEYAAPPSRTQRDRDNTHRLVGARLTAGDGPGDPVRRGAVAEARDGGARGQGQLGVGVTLARTDG
ncbi:MAG: hypothetical protein AB7Y46_02375 [Armatimonadota bacterium]